MTWLLIALLLALGIFLIISQINIKNLYKEYSTKINKIKAAEKINLKSYIGTGKLLRSLDKRIEKSNIRFYISYNVWIHLALCMALFLLASGWMSNHMNIYSSITFGLVVALIPYILLQLFSDLMGHKVKRMSVDFLTIMRRFLIGGKGADIFQAFKKASKYILQPLKNYVEIMIYEYEHKVNPVQCFDNMIERIEGGELKLYIENLKICYVRGGDVIELTDTFIEEIEKQNDDEDEENTKDLLLSMGLYLLLAVNFFILYILFNSSYKTAVFDSSWGQIVFILDLLVSFYIAYLTLEKID